MIIKKITPGFVIQEFDTVKMEFVSQNFTAAEQVDYEDENGANLGPIEAAELGMELADGTMPQLNFDMIPPLAVENTRECTQEDLLVLLDGLPNEAQIRVCQIVVDNFQKFFGK